MIKGVIVKKLKKIEDERGCLLEILRADDKIFEKFGQVYFTTCRPGIVKAWHYHKKKIDNFVCLKGKARLGLYDSRDDSETKGEVMEFIMSLDEPFLVKIPPGVVHGFEALGNEECMILNTTTIPYNPEDTDEYRIDPFNNDIPLKWNAKKGG